MKRKNKLIFSCILALALCALLFPSSFAEEEAVEPQAVEEIVEEIVEETVEETVEVEVPAVEEVSVDETVEETVEETVDETVVIPEEEEIPEDEAEGRSPEAVEEIEPVNETVIIPEEEETAPEVPEEIGSPELQGNDNEVCYSAMFYGLNDSVATLKGGEEMELNELISSLGYEGEIESAESSNPEALEIADGKVRILNPFGDETIKLVIGGQEVAIKVHDPEGTAVTKDNIIASFADGGIYFLSGNTEIDNGKLIIPSGKTVTLDLNGFTLNGKAGTNGSVITVKGALILNDTSAKQAGVITGGTGFEKEYGTNGGGVFVESTGLFIMNGGCITGNSADGGGGVYVNRDNIDSFGTFTMTDGRITDNAATYGGGGVSNYGIFTVTGGSIDDNLANWGGGVDNNESFILKEDGCICNNTAEYGGGVYTYKGNFNMTGGKISGNIATGNDVQPGYGGGVNNTGSHGRNFDSEGQIVAATINGSFIMSGGEISYNYADFGGGVYNFVNLTVNGGTITNNSAIEGGGIFNTGTLKITSGKISNNSAEVGGGVYVDRYSNLFSMGEVCIEIGVLTMTDGNIIGNIANSGGGVFNFNGKISMSDGSISDNTAYYMGGGIYNAGEMTVGGDAQITGNEKGTAGNNLYLTDGTTVTIATGEENPNGMSIGVTLESGTGDVTDENDADYSEFFTSDNANYIVVNGADDVVQLIPAPSSEASEAAEAVSVYVDGELLTKDIDYNWVDGKVVFTAEFLETLEEGEHTLTIAFPGFTVEESFSFTDGAVVPAVAAKHLAV